MRRGCHLTAKSTINVLFVITVSDTIVAVVYVLNCKKAIRYQTVPIFNTTSRIRLSLASFAMNTKHIIEEIFFFK